MKYVRRYWFFLPLLPILCLVVIGPQPTRIAGLISGGLGLVFVALMLHVMFHDEGNTELEPIRKERREIQERLVQKPADVFETVQLSLNQLTEYYTINKSQARNSFRFSVAAIGMGLLTLVAGVWLFYLKKLDVQIATLSSIAGLLLQFIGGANFYVYNKSLTQLNYFYDRLVRMQDTMLAIKLCDQIEDANQQQSIKAALIRYLMERTAQPQIAWPTEQAGDHPAKSNAAGANA